MSELVISRVDVQTLLFGIYNSEWQIKGSAI